MVEHGSGLAEKFVGGQFQPSVYPAYAVPQYVGVQHHELFVEKGFPSPPTTLVFVAVVPGNGIVSRVGQGLGAGQHVVFIGPAHGYRFVVVAVLRGATVEW